MAANIVTTNIIQGPANIWVGAFGATEPADTAVGVAGDPSTGWTFAGATTNGVDLTILQTFKEIQVDQVVDDVGARLNKRGFEVATELAEPTAANLALAMNATLAAPGTGVQVIDPVSGDASLIPAYAALIIDGQAPQSTAGVGKRRRLIVRKVLSYDNVAMTYDPDKETTLKVKFHSFYVSASILPFHIVDLT